MLEFYVTFDELKEKLDEEAPNKYTNALDFLTKLKFIMAKLTVRPTYAHQIILLITNMQLIQISDWTSLYESILRSKVKKFKKLLPIVVAYGHEFIESASQIGSNDLDENRLDSQTVVQYLVVS